jgi:membrane-associated phospholipid phosphatase
MPVDSRSAALDVNKRQEMTHDVKTSSPESSFHARLRANLGHKLFLLCTVPLAVYVPYFGLQHWVLFPVHKMAATALDRAVPFQPDAVWPYNSIYFLVLLPPVFMTSKAELNRFARAVLATGLLANLCFLFWPTTCPRPVLEQPHAAYEFLVSVDAPLHACPSLHAAFSVLGALCLAPALGQSWNRLWSFAAWFWVGVIFYGTLATKQHVLTDLLAGSALAALAFYFVYRRAAAPQQ